MTRDTATLGIKRTRNTAFMPTKATDRAAGFDLYACLDAGDYFVLPPGSRAVIPTRIALEIPDGYEVQIRSRSGLAAKQGLVVLNSPGTIDEDYRGEIGVILQNTSATPARVDHGDRIAQMVLNKLPQCVLEEVNELSSTERNDKGFGSSGVKLG